MKLAELLADFFTVYIPDRRGRGLSGAYVENHILQAEGEDMQAIVNKTKTQNIFGLSSGAVVVLQTALVEPALKKIALYEPPIPVNGKNFLTFTDGYENALSKRNYGKAFIAIIKALDDPSSFFRILPRFVTIPLMNFAIRAEAKKVKATNEVSLKELIPTFHYDAKLVNESADIIDKCKNLTTDILFLSGQKSQPFLKDILNKLSVVLPQAKRTEFRGLGHTAADNGGKPEVVANELRKFFGTN